MGHIRVKNKTRKYMSIFGTILVIALSFGFGFVLGALVTSL